MYAGSGRNGYHKQGEEIKKPQPIRIAANSLQVVPKVGIDRKLMITVSY